MATKSRAVTLKLKVQWTEANGPDGKRVRLFVDYTDPRNKEWANATPYAQLEMSVKNTLAAEVFTEGKNFLVTLEPED